MGDRRQQRAVSFINSNSGPPSVSDFRLLLTKLQRIGLLAIIFLIITFVSAEIYFVGSSHGWGLRPTFSESADDGAPHPIKFWDCVYFSLVTIATLGYGDYRPESFSRVVAMTEVISGIVLAGIFVSRLVSEQQERLTIRLVRGQLNSEIQRLRSQLAPLVTELCAGTIVLSSTRSSDTLNKTSGLFASIARYLRYQANEPDLSLTIPTRAAARLLGEMTVVLETIWTLADSKSKRDIHRNDRKAIRAIAEATLLASKVLTSAITDVGMKHNEQRILRVIVPLRRQLKLHKP